MASEPDLAREVAAAALIGSWDPAGGTAHHRLGTLLASMGYAVNLAADTLGERNRRLLALHRDVVGGALEARVRCGSCGVDSEFEVPADAILELPAPYPDTTVTIGKGRQRRVFRLPRMDDLDAAADASSAGQVRRTVLERCLVRGVSGEVPELEAHRLAARFEALDPAANVVVNVSCSSCGAALSATVDVAVFVARALDRLVDALMREIDVIASAYGWDEGRILALPAWRRRRYVELIQSARNPSRTGIATRAI